MDSFSYIIYIIQFINIRYFRKLYADGGGSVVKEPIATPRARKMVHLHTHTTQPIQTEADIDHYLQKLKAELMQHIGGDYDIIIS